MKGPDTFTRRAVLAIVATAAFGAVLSFVALPLLNASEDGFDPFESICSAIGINRPRDVAQVKPSQPTSNVAWTLGTLAEVGRGDPNAGGALAEDLCVSCHLTNTSSSDPATVPNITGIPPRAIYKQLVDMKMGQRPNEQMKPLMDDMTLIQMADLAAFYGQLPLRHQDFRAIEGDEAAELVTDGDAARSLPACSSCHEPALGGPAEAPTLSGQYPAYIATQLRAYAKGERKNDLYGRMRTVAAKLTEQEIVSLSKYYDGWR